MLRVLWRGPALAALILGYACAGAMVRLFSRASALRGRQARLTGYCSRLGLKVLGVRVRREGRPYPAGCMMTANHLSYLDILVWASLHPVTFVTSVEVGGDPFLGALSKLGGSEFVERRKATGLRSEIESLSRLLACGGTVMLFPEGTSTDGSGVRPFKAGLLEAALRTEVPVQPACLQVTAVGGQPFGPATADLWCWYGRMRFLPHLLTVLAVPSFEVTARFLPLLHPTEEATRRDLADAAHFVVSSAYAAPPVSIRPVDVSAGLGQAPAQPGAA